MASEDGVAASRSAAQPEERRTETTLTTRIRINIPGSRPIPPVVVRTPVADADPADESDADTETTSTMSALGTAEAPVEPSAPAEEKSSDWFAPRKPAAGKGPQGTGSTNGAGLPGGSGIQGANGASGAGARGANGASSAPGGPGAGGARTGGPGANGMGGARPGASGAPGVPGARSGGSTGAVGPLGAHPGGTKGQGLPGATGAGPVAPGHGGGTGSFDVSDAVAASTASFPVIGTEDGDEPRRDDLPYFSDSRVGPSGPTGGPVTGDGPVIPPVGPTPGVPGQGVPGRSPGGPRVPGAPGTGPGGPLGPGAPGAAMGQGLPGGGLSDDTAILTPQKPAPEPGAQSFGGPGDNVSGHTLTSGIPVVPPGAQNGPFGMGSPADGPGPHTPPKLPDPPKAQSSTGAKPARKKGRSKLVLVVGGLFAVAGVAYGAGLLMNHSDVPKGTTVLGVDIGGGTRDEAIQKLDAALGSRSHKPLQLSVDGRTLSLSPDQSGLQLDSKATVAAAAQSDYNPVSVIGSLFGGHRVVQPVMPVDEEKLQAALQRAAGGAGSMTEGTIKFESGKAVAVYGKTGKGADVAGSTNAIEQAYRTQVETGAATPVAVPTTTRQPTVSNAEVDRMMKEFAEPAMSALVTVRTDATHSVSFSPARSIYKFLSVQAVNGKLVEHYDLAVLKQLYGSAFDGVTIAKGDGSKKPVSPQDVASALGQALRGKTAAQRVVTISTNPQ
ncbi:membrane protein [Streptomyces hygroscopicus]|nr:membrane protein [Streptomyces hygroscopicus]